jgi:hypothetical protein
VPDLWGVSFDAIPWRDRAWVYWGLGEDDSLASTLEKAAAVGSAVIDPSYLSFGVYYERVKDHPQFVELRRRVGLE